MGKSHLFFLLFLISIAATGQDYIIDHDLLSSKTTYLRSDRPNDTSRVKSILLKRQGKIVLKVENYNPFYYNAKVTTYKAQTDEESSNVGVYNPFSLLNNSMGSWMKNLVPGLDFISQASRSTDDADNKGNEGYLYWAGIYQELYNRYQGLTSFYDDLSLLKIKLNELKYDIQKPAIQIKTETRQAVQSVLNPDELDFANVVKSGRMMNAEYINLTDSLRIVKARLDQIAPNTDRNYFFENTTLGAVADKINTVDRRKLTSSEQVDFLNPLAEVAKVYKEIMLTDYRFTYTINSESNLAQLKLQLYSRLDSVAKDTITRYFPVQSRGNLRLRNSIGISFTYFEDKNRGYFINPDTTIGSSSADYFTPVISTFIHFYGFRAKNFKLGGSIGFGIPVTGEKKDINYLLGISGILGHNEPIIVSVGISGTKVTRLFNGWETGQKVPSLNFNIPTQSVFRAGIFLAVSFNLGRMSVSKNTD
jgi:hypothetical protein